MLGYVPPPNLLKFKIKSLLMVRYATQFVVLSVVFA